MVYKEEYTNTHRNGHLCWWYMGLGTSFTVLSLHFYPYMPIHFPMDFLSIHICCCYRVEHPNYMTYSFFSRTKERERTSPSLPTRGSLLQNSTLYGRRKGSREPRLCLLCFCVYSNLSCRSSLRAEKEFLGGIWRMLVVLKVGCDLWGPVPEWILSKHHIWASPQCFSPSECENSCSV